MYFSPGLWGIDIVTLQALAILTYIVRFAATHATRVIVGTADATLLPVAEESVREAYASRRDSRRPVPSGGRALRLGRPVRLRAGLGGDHGPRADGDATSTSAQFFAEALILTENGRALGAFRWPAAPDPTQIPFFIATCDYVVIGDEYYAASAYLTREPTLTGSLVGQDIWRRRC